MAKKNYYALGLCGLLALALCQSPVDAKTGIRISSFDPTLDSCEISTGIVYFLPKSVGKATYTYNLYKVTKTTKEDDKEKKTYSYYAKIESTPTIEMVSLADPDLGFEINPSNLKGLTIATAIEGISIWCVCYLLVSRLLKKVMFQSRRSRREISFYLFEMAK